MDHSMEIPSSCSPQQDESATCFPGLDDSDNDSLNLADNDGFHNMLKGYQVFNNDIPSSSRPLASVITVPVHNDSVTISSGQIRSAAVGATGNSEQIHIFTSSGPSSGQPGGVGEGGDDRPPSNGLSVEIVDGEVDIQESHQEVVGGNSSSSNVYYSDSHNHTTLVCADDGHYVISTPQDGQIPGDESLLEHVVSEGSEGPYPRDQIDETDVRMSQTASFGTQTGVGDLGLQRVTYTLGFKLEVVAYSKAYGNRAAARSFGVDLKRVLEWRRQEEDLLDDGEEEGVYMPSIERMPPTKRRRSQTDEQSAAGEQLISNGSSTGFMSFGYELPPDLPYDTYQQRSPRLSANQKLEIIAYAKLVNKSAAARKFFVDRKRIDYWMKGESRLRCQRDRDNLKLRLDCLNEPLVTMTTIDDLDQVILQQPDDGCSEESNIIVERDTELACHSILDDSSVSVSYTDRLKGDDELQCEDLREEPCQDSDTTLSNTTTTTTTHKHCKQERLTDKRFPLHQSYTAEFKLEVIKFAKQSTKRTAARVYGVDRKRVQEWLRQEGQLTQSDSQSKRASGGGRRVLNPDAEHLLINWLTEAITMETPVTGQALKVKAMEIFRAHGELSFRASNGWFTRFRSRYNLRYDPGSRTIVFDTDPVEPSPQTNSSINSALNFIISEDTRTPTTDDDDDEDEVGGGNEGDTNIGNSCNIDCSDNTIITEGEHPTTTLHLIPSGGTGRPVVVPIIINIQPSTQLPSSVHSWNNETTI